MTEPLDPDLIALATPYALHAVSDSELADIERRVAAAPPAVAQAFDDEVRAVRATMAVVSAATAVEPPGQLRDRLLARPPRLILACSEGVAAWRQTGVISRVVGDEPGVTWWKLLEVRHSPAPFELTSAEVVGSSEVAVPH